MSLRRAVEAHIKFCLDPHFVTSRYQVVESLRLVDRPIPSIIIVAGAARPALPDLPASYDNWSIPVTVVVNSLIDDTTVDQHNEVSYTLGQVLATKASRFYSTVQGLYVYDIIRGSQGQENEGRKMIAVHNYEAMVNYSPNPSLDPPA